MKKYFSGIILGSLVLLLASPVAYSNESQTLTEQLAAKAAASSENTPPEVQAVMKKAIQDLRASDIEEKALKKGDSLPAFTLPGVDGKAISSVALLKQGPLVVSFYRGGWCPYCNLQLHDLQKHLSEIHAKGAQLVAISPQTPDASLSTAEKAELKFHVLSDKDGQVARRFGLLYKMPPDLVELYRGFGLDLEKSNGNKNWELPLAATYVVSKDGKIVYSFVDADYKKRAETVDLLRVLEGL